MGSRTRNTMAYRSTAGASSSGSGSRYPSAYGHTPSYRSYNSIGTGSSSAYDTPLTSSAYKSDLARDLARDHGVKFEDKFFDVDRAFDTPLTSSTSGGGSSGSSSKKVSSYSYSSSSSSAANGGRPVVEYSTD